MERHPSFDDPPEPNRFGAAVRIVVALLVFAILPAGIFFGGAAVGWTFLAAFVAFLAGRAARELSAILMHTTYRLLDLWLGVMLCGAAVGSIVGTANAVIEEVNDPNATLYGWIVCVCLVLLALCFALRGLYYGLRLAMWLNAEGGERLVLLLLGLVGYMAHFGWSACVASFAIILIILGNDPPDPHVFWWALAVSLAVGAFFFGLTRVHLHYRKRAQENFEADPEGQGKAGRLVPEGGRAGIFRVLGNAVGFVMRLLGGGRG